MKKFLLLIVIIFSGINYSQDFWQIANQSADPPNNKYINQLLFVKNGDLIVSAQDSGLFRSTDLGESWIHINEGINSAHTSTLAISSEGILYSDVYASTTEGGFLYSTDNGMEWIRKSSRTTSSARYYIFAFDSNYVFLSAVWGGGAKQYSNSYSSDGGTTWNLSNAFTGVLTSIIKLNDGTILGHYDTPNGSYSAKSTDHGKNWTSLSNNVSFYQVPAMIDLGQGCFFAGTYGDGLYISSNYGDTWFKVDDRSVSSLRVTSLTSDFLGNIYAGTDGKGVYQSIDNGVTWKQINSGLNNLYITSVICSKEGYLFAGTYAGVYRTILPLTDVKTTEQPRKIFTLEQNYPNPFNPNTTISYSIPERGYVKLTVYNSLGQTISELVNEEKPAGSFSVRFNAANLPSGIYLYKLTAGNYSETKKLILLK